MQAGNCFSITISISCLLYCSQYSLTGHLKEDNKKIEKKVTAIN